MTSRPDRIPKELFFGNPEKASPKISPDGRRLAYLAPDEGVLNIWEGPVAGPAKPVTQDRRRGIRNYFWAEDGSLLYIQDRDGDENWHLYKAAPGGAVDLTPFPGVMAQVVATDPKLPDSLVVALNKRDARVHDAYTLSLSTGELTLQVENPGDVTGWLADSRLKVRAGKAMRPDGGTELRLLEDGKWRVFMSWGPDDAGGAHGFTPDGRGLYVESSHESDTTRLYEMSLDGKSSRVLAERQGADVSNVLVHPTDYHVEAVAFETDRLEWKVLDAALEPDFAALRTLAPGDFSIISRDDADTTWLLVYNADKRPPCYYVYDRASRKGEFLFSSRPKLDGLPLSPMEPVKIKARDGLVLQGYLTTPAGAEPRNLPLVLNVHGGPWVRDGWGYHPEAQWLANLGYAVLQVNYRGSSGFGKRFLHAGDREWGAKMQDDLTDSVKWAVERGVADPKRVAIYGGSYGGYAALAGACFTPTLYRCAVDIVGPSNLETLIKSIPPYWEPMKRVFDLRVGDLQKEPEFLRSRSPLFHADKIEIPLLIAQGANDPRVKRAESEMIVDALKKRGKPVEYVCYEDEGHGFARPQNRLDFYGRVEKFLAERLN